MEEAEIREKIISYGKQRYRVNSKNKWLVCMFGTFGPADNGIPRHGWVSIPENKVPDGVRKLARQ